MQNEIVIIIQARLSSTRLPGKVLKPFIADQTILSLQVDGLKALGFPIILATSINKADDPLELFAEQHQIECFRGSESDVLSRFIEATSSKYLIRVCSDNPFLDINSVHDFIASLEEGNDYISYMDSKETPAIKTHWGLFTELVSKKALQKAYQLTKAHPEKSFYREHVTNYLYGNPEQFKVNLLPAPDMLINRSDLRFTVDTQEDFLNMQHLYKLVSESKEGFSLANLISIVDKNPEIKNVMTSGINRFRK